MRHVLTLIGASVEAFPVPVADEVAAKLTALGATVARPLWLGPAACDLVYDGADPARAAHGTAELLAGKPIDLISQEVEGRRKKLLVADMESTMIAQEMLDELAEQRGLRDEVSAVTARAMNGEIDFKEAVAARVALLAGMSIATLHDAWQHVDITPGARALVATMRRNGGRAILVSGGFTIFTAKLREELGFDEDHANELEWQRGALTGALVPPIRDKDDKLAVLQAEITAGGLTAADALTVGDGANDLPMLLAAGLGVAYHAKPRVREAAHHRVDHADLSALLYAQGYRREQFVSW